MAAVRSLEAPRTGPRTYVLDTNVLLYDPNALEVFEDNDLVIPITVIEEVDRFKKDLNETGRNARMVSRRLDELRSQGRLSKGVPLPSGGKLRVEIPSPNGPEQKVPSILMNHSNDNQIIGVAHKLCQTSDPGDVILVTRDTNMRIKADSLGIHAEDYEHAHIHIDESYTGVKEVTVSSEQIGELYSQGWLPWDEGEAYPNQFLLLKAEDNPSQTLAMSRSRSGYGLSVSIGKVFGVFSLAIRNSCSPLTCFWTTRLTW